LLTNSIQDTETKHTEDQRHSPEKEEPSTTPSNNSPVTYQIAYTPLDVTSAPVELLDSLTEYATSPPRSTTFSTKPTEDPSIETRTDTPSETSSFTLSQSDMESLSDPEIEPKLPESSDTKSEEVKKRSSKLDFDDIRKLIKAQAVVRGRYHRLAFVKFRKNFLSSYN
jgi:hypothetical protein